MASVGSQDVENIKGNVNVLFLLSQTDIKKISISNTLNGQPIDVPFVYSPKNTGNSFYWNILTENFTKWGGAVGPVS